MGGFHGGHSGGGGGFHGGGGHHGGGGRTTTHVVVGGHHYYHGRRYYGPYYGDNDGKPMTFAGSIIISVVMILIGLFVFFAMYGVRCTATITKAQLTGSSYDTYETYDFEYTYRGTKYTGYGDDDAKYENGTYVLSILEGEQYPIYVNMITPESYSFEDNNVLAVLVFLIFACIGGAMIINSIKVKKAYEKKLAEVGDYNHDGKLDEHDIEAYESTKKGENEGTYEGMKRASEENTYNREKIRKYCKYCGKEADDDAKFCSGCGASL